MSAQRLMPRVLLLLGVAGIIAWAAINRDRLDLGALDKRSASAATILSDAGFRNVSVLRGGMEQWKP